MPKQMQEYEQGLEKVYEDYKETALRKSELALKLKEESIKEADERRSGSRTDPDPGTDRKAPAGVG